MFSRQEKFLLFVIAAIQFAHIVDFMIMMPLGPQLIRIFSISAQEFSFLVASYTLFAGISGFVSSFFMDRFERKRLLLFFFTGFALSTLVCAFSPNFYFLLIARSLAGTFGGVLNSITLSIVSDNFPYEKRGTAMGWTSTSFSLASILGVPFSIYLAMKFNWHAPFVFLGATCFALFIFIFKFVPPRTVLSRGKNTPLLDPLIEVMGNRNLMMGLWFMVFIFLGQFAVIPFISPTLVANAGLAEDQLPLMYLCGGLTSIIGSPLIGRFSDRIGKHKIFIFGATLSMIPIYLLTHLGASPTPLILAISSVFFVSMTMRMVPAMALVSAAPAPERRGSYMSLVSSVQSLSSALASSLAGYIVVKNQTTGRLDNYQAVGYIAIFFTILAILISHKVQHTTPAKK
ncbi:MAG: MFS transporter [Bdellovibrionaceae bacterium]|nr:MFS transporter [Pseudobdellovibrionaceae bacterium]